MKRKKYLLLNILFIAISIAFLILSFMFKTFFFLPILCCLPFTCSSGYFADTEQKKPGFIRTEYPKQQVCPYCKEIIEQPDAKYCYHCGAKLKAKGEEK
ncbi:MAG: zinc ribbon domain-containing protein [Promethearchaeia archaeon]